MSLGSTFTTVNGGLSLTQHGLSTTPLIPPCFVMFPLPISGWIYFQILNSFIFPSLAPVIHCHDYRGFKISHASISTFFSFPASSKFPLNFHMNIRISFAVSQKTKQNKIFWNFHWDCIEWYRWVLEGLISPKFESSARWTQYISTFRSSLISSNMLFFLVKTLHTFCQTYSWFLVDCEAMINSVIVNTEILPGFFWLFYTHHYIICK